jgi:rRNA-processing protein FCF1
MPDSINIVFDVSSNIDKDSLAKHVENFNGKARNLTNEYQRSFWSINGLSVILYERKLVVQGELSEMTKPFIKGLRDVKGLTLDLSNRQKLMSLFPIRQNSIVCTQCGKTSLVIQGQIEGLDISFSLECGHRCNLEAPFQTLNNRVLPDINMILSKSVSRLINLGLLKGAEIVFPEVILDIVDKFKGTGSKDAISEELESLRKIAEKGASSISINTFSNLPMTYRTTSPEEEDKVILDFVQFTNSILMTADNMFKERALMQGRPTIYVNPKDFGKLQMIEEVRTQQ